MPEIPTEPDPDTPEPEIPVSTGEKRKRSFSMKSSELQPYRKKTTISHFEFLIQAVAKPGKLQLVYHRDLLWMMSTAFCQNIPMWVG